ILIKKLKFLVLSNFGKNLRALRKARGLSQNEMADLLDVTSGTISNYEQGTSNPDIPKLLYISTFFNVSIDDILKIDLSKSSLKRGDLDTPNDTPNDTPKGTPKGRSNEDLIPENSKESKNKTVDEDARANVVLKMLDDFANVEIDRSAPVVRFQVYNDNMAPTMDKNDNTLGHRISLEKLKTNELCALVGENEFYWIGRVTWKEDGFYVVNYDDKTVPPDLIPAVKVKEIYKLLYLFKPL
ncbi:helix-turn-helix transcriptional regulator, partial [Flavilitoribacter nigricans]|uniref:helix-turn-helix transcriptional regulator n=1 Tax=Flavilitoribacter nigricans TaxID=70997 RepID=UPI001C9E9B41